jgi:hypothetical protein
MLISSDENSVSRNTATHFRVEFRNVGQRDITITPGTLHLCDGQRAETGAIKLNLVDPQGRPHRHLPFLGDGPPYSPGCGGQMTSFTVPLPPGVSLSIPLDLGKYVDLSDSKDYEGKHLSAGTYSLQAELPAENTVSNTIQVRFDTEVGVPLDDYPR